MLKPIAIIIVILLAALLIYATTRPDTFRVERTVNIKAPPEKIFGFINDFRRWEAWTPFNKDLAMKKTYSGASEGVGAIYEWDGNKDVGKGSVEITESLPPSKISIKLDFIKPFEVHNTAEFTLKSQDETTDVTWATYGQQPLIGKVMSIFFDCDKMLGTDFENGLAKLKAQAEM